jgi:hypothetical protein
MRRLRTARVWSFRGSHPTEVRLAVRSQAPGDDQLRLGRGFACVLIALAPVVHEPASECNALYGAAAVGALDRRRSGRPVVAAIQLNAIVTFLVLRRFADSVRQRGWLSANRSTVLIRASGILQQRHFG